MPEMFSATSPVRLPWLRVVAQAAKAAGATQLTGHYIPSPRNGIVAGHFRDPGFVAAGETPQGHTLWTLDLAGYSSPDLPLRLDAGAVFAAQDA